MGTAGRKEKEKEIRKNDIIDAAERVFFSRGYSTTTMDDVACEAEFSKRTIYVYFNSKEQIYFEIMTRGYRLMIGMLNTGMQTKATANAIEKIRQMADTLYTFSHDYPNYFKAIMEYENGELDFSNGIPDQAREDCYALGEQVFENLIGILKNGTAEGVLRNDLDVGKTALVLWSCMIGVFTTVRRKEQYIRNYHHTTPEEMVSSAFELLIRSIQN